MNIMQIIVELVKRNPEAINSPRGQSLIQVLQSGDEKRGEETAMSILQSMGLSKEEGIPQAKAFLGIR